MELGKVMKVYSGRAGACMCGCNGHYRVASAHAKAAGYDADDVNDRSVKIIFNKITKDPAHKFDADANCVYLDTPTRTLVAYFSS